MHFDRVHGAKAHIVDVCHHFDSSQNAVWFNTFNVFPLLTGRQLQLAAVVTLIIRVS